MCRGPQHRVPSGGPRATRGHDTRLHRRAASPIRRACVRRGRQRAPRPRSSRRSRAANTATHLSPWWRPRSRCGRPHRYGGALGADRRGHSRVRLLRAPRQRFRLHSSLQFRDHTGAARWLLCCWRFLLVLVVEVDADHLHGRRCRGELAHKALDQRHGPRPHLGGLCNAQLVAQAPELCTDLRNVCGLTSEGVLCSQQLLAPLLDLGGDLCGVLGRGLLEQIV
mmetsp:Transcript_83239/g.240864  ORF Transcript_83239/g.240864 Transcript_83239/m.240864 type:complete len:224 (-) Transcript_83239:12-683(-)